MARNNLVTHPDLFQVTARNGVTFNTRVVVRGERYGLDLMLIHDKDQPLIEFYDARFPFTPYGQFISRYFLKRLFEWQPVCGINLDEGVDDWSIDPITLAKIQEHYYDATQRHLSAIPTRPENSTGTSGTA